MEQQFQCNIESIRYISPSTGLDRCGYVQNYCAKTQQDINFLEIYFCYINESTVILIAFSVLFIYLIFRLLQSTAEKFLTPGIEKVAGVIGCSETLAGVTILAFGNGAPDVLTAVIAGGSNEGEGIKFTVGLIFGAGLFSFTYTLGLIVIESKDKHVKAVKETFIRDSIFYLIGCTFLIVYGFIGYITWFMALIFFAIYFVYIGFIIYLEYFLKAKKLRQSTMQVIVNLETLQIPQIQGEDTESIISAKSTKIPFKEKKIQHQILHVYNLICDVARTLTIPPGGEDQWNKYLAIITTFTSPLFVIFTGLIKLSEEDQLQALKVILPISFILSVIIWKTCSINTPPKYHIIFSICEFIMSLVWISVLVTILIDYLTIITQINSIYIGLTLLAIGDSAGDHFTNVGISKMGHSVMALASCLGSQVFNLLFGFGLALFIQITLPKKTIDFSILQGDNAFEISENFIGLTIMVCTLIHVVVMLVQAYKSKFVVTAQHANQYLVYYITILIICTTLAAISDILREEL